jgi:ABC-type amino acid transport substrate-binding protein
MRKRLLFFPLVLCLLALVAGGWRLAPPLQAAAAAQAAPTDLGLSPLAANGDWAAVQASGVLTVGTSAASPPFAFYTADFAIDGFDAALMQAIADKLGVQLALVDYAFDGLPAALQVGQIDAVAATLTMTPERAQVVDFSMPYYLSSEAILAGASSPLKTIDLNTQDFTALRLGVQRGTIYAAWAQTHLIDAQRLPAANLQLFNREQDIVQALQEEKIDLGMMDYLPAQEYVRAGKARQVGANQVLQQYAIAVRKGSALLPQINLALTQLQQEGTLAKLHERYLAPDEEGQPQPTPTPAPPAPACQDVSGYVADLTYADSDTNIPFVPAGQPFVKTWRLVNHGTCPWAPGYALTYAPMPDSRPEDRMGGVSVPLQTVVPPGQTVDLSATLVAPQAPGSYKGLWQMVNAQGQPFGQRVWVRIQVPSSNPPTPAPTPTPVKGINFTVDRTSIRSGQCVNFRWDVTNVLAVYFYRDGEEPGRHGVAGQSSRQECPQATTTYYLRVDKRDGTSATPTITIYVARDPDAPYIQYFTASPAVINPLGCATLSWQAAGQVDRVKIKRNGGSWWSDAPAAGSQQDCSLPSGGYTYELEATGPGGKTLATTYLTVVDAPAPTPTPYSPAPVPAVIDYFTLDATSIWPNGCINAAWSVGGGVTSVTVLIDDDPVARGVGYVGSQQFCPASSGGQTLVFGLAAQGMAGTQPDTRQVVVQVQEVEPTPTPTPEPLPTVAPEPPVIGDFGADRYSVNAGECVNLYWSVGGWVDVVQLYRDGAYLYDVGANDGRQECFYDPGSFHYRLRAANSAGLEDSRDLAIDVAFMPGPIDPEPIDPDPEPEPWPEPDEPVFGD